MKLFEIINFIIRHPMNRGGKMKAIARFLRWQVATRIIDQEIVMPFVDDVKLVISRGMTGGTGNWYCGLHELTEMAFLLHYLGPEDLFVDIGANIGSYSLLASGAVGAKTIAIEPIPSTYRNLVRNVKLNDLEDLIEAYCIGISDRRDKLKFTTSLNTMNRRALDDETEDVVSVPVQSLDSLLNGRVPRMIKIDVEGYEAKVIEGARRTMEAEGLDVIIMETNSSGERYGYTDDVITQRICEFGFSPFQYDPFARHLRPTTTIAANTIFLRNAEAADLRCQRAPRFQLVNGCI